MGDADLGGEGDFDVLPALILGQALQHLTAVGDKLFVSGGQGAESLQRQVTTPRVGSRKRISIGWPDSILQLVGTARIRLSSGPVLTPAETVCPEAGSVSSAFLQRENMAM